MNQFPNVQPDQVRHRDFTVSYCGGGPVVGSELLFVVVRIAPEIVASPELMIGHGQTDYHARADAYQRAKALIDANASLNSRGHD